MFENQMNPFEYARLHAGGCDENKYSRQYNAALSRFKATLAGGSFFRLCMKLLHRPSKLYDLNAIKASLHVRGSSYAGIKVVPIHAIVGSEGRTSDFDYGLHPMSETSRERWMNIAMTYINRLPLPPVQLIEIGNTYFIRDGHHRVSVARAFGQTAMDAEVITWNAAPPFPWQREVMPDTILSLEQADLSTCKG